MYKKIGSLAALGVGIVSSPKIANAEQITTLKKLVASGINHEFIVTKFHEAQINIGWTEALKVSAEDEGKKIRLETLDRISVVVPIESAVGNPNKIDPDLF